MQAFYTLSPIEKVERSVKTNPDNNPSGQEGKKNLEFQKVLLQYYNNKAMQYQDSTPCPSRTYGRNAVETLYEGASTVNFFG